MTESELKTKFKILTKAIGSDRCERIAELVSTIDEEEDLSGFTRLMTEFGEVAVRN